MGERLKSIGIVTILTLIVWLFAESESLTEDELPARVDVMVGEVNRDKLLARAVDFDGRISIEVRGPRAAINRASQLMQTPIRLQPGGARGAIPATDGSHVIRMLDFIKAWPELAATGVWIDYVRPAEIRVEVQELQVVDLQPMPQLTDVAIDGEVRFVPAEVSVRVPKSVADAPDRPQTISIPISPDDAEQLGPGPQTVSVPVQLPESMRGKPGVTLLTPQVVASFTVVDTNITERFTSVPVQVLVPPVEFDDWSIAVAPEDAILQVDVRGPRQAIEALKTPLENLVGVVSMLDVDLTSGTAVKAVRFVILRDGVAAPLPPGVEVLSEKTEVRVITSRRVGPSPPP